MRERDRWVPSSHSRTHRKRMIQPEMPTSSYLTVGRNLYSIKDVHSIWHPYWMQDSSQEGEKFLKPDMHCVSHHWTPMRFWRRRTLLAKKRSFTKESRKNTLKTQFLGFNLGEHKRKTCRYGNEIACNHHKQHGAIWLLNEWSQRGEMTIYQRSSTPRLAPLVFLKIVCH